MLKSRKKMSRRKRSQNRKTKTEEEILEDLDRFAGSSDEEEEQNATTEISDRKSKRLRKEGSESSDERDVDDQEENVTESKDHKKVVCLVKFGLRKIKFANWVTLIDVRDPLANGMDG